MTNVPAPSHPGTAAAVVLALLRAYKVLLSPLFGGCCRFYPSCSDYMRDAVVTHGAARGAWLGIRRLTRCHPFGSHGFDPCPARPPVPTDRAATERVHGT